MNHVIITGFMGSGKTAVGKRLAKRLGWAFVDLDELVEEREGRPIADIFESGGEQEFRRLERSALADLELASPAIVATGGGTFMDPANRRRLKELGVVVCLVADMDTILERVSRNDTRPLAAGRDSEARLRRLWEKRLPDYRKADVIVETDGLTVEQSAARVLHMVKPRLQADGGERVDEG
ncbi:MAG: shikimate kinase [Candidatus Binatia bacterium]